MSTTMMPEMSPAALPAQPAIRYPAVFANLMPEEVIIGRRARKLRQQILVALGVLVVLLAAWFGYSVLQTSNTKSDLASANRTTADLQAQQLKFAPLLLAQQQSATITSKLSSIMRSDVPWAKLLDGLRRAAPKGVNVGSISASLVSTGSQSTSSTGGGLDVLNNSGKGAIGTLTMSGSASDKSSVATYVEALPGVTGVAAAFPESVQGAGTSYTWTITAILTTDALGGRYSTTQGGH